jgi:hypothetical protein
MRWRAPVPPVRKGKLAALDMISKGALSFMSFFDSDNNERKRTRPQNGAIDER